MRAAALISKPQFDETGTATSLFPLVLPTSLLVSWLFLPFAFSLSGFARGQEYLIRKVREQVHGESYFFAKIGFGTGGEVC